MSSPRDGGPPPSDRAAGATTGNAVRLDVAFVVALSLAVGLPFVGSLGWYSDDWEFRGAVRFGAPGFAGAFASLEPLDTAARPAQFLYLAGLLSTSFDRPWLVHAVMLATMVLLPLLLYACIRTFGYSLETARVAAIVFAVAPNASTDRYWFASPANLGLMFALGVVLLGQLRLAGARTRRMAARAGSVACVVLAGTSYELFLPLIAAYACWCLRWRRYRLAGAICSALFTVGALKVVDASRVHDLRTQHFFYPARVFEFAVVHVGELVALLPADAIAAARYSASWSLDGLAIGIGCACAAYVMYATRDVPSRAEAARAFILGFIVFWLGLSVFATGAYFGTTATGSDNRIALASTTGIALAIAGAAAAAARLGWSRGFGRALYASSVGVYAGCATSVVFAVGASWCDAAAAQTRVLATIRTDVPKAAPVLILSGFCPYVGAAVVFETWWDTSGALRVAYGNPRLVGDVLTPFSTADEHGITIDFYGKLRRYRFARTLHGLDLETGTSTVLASESAASSFVRRGRLRYYRACPAAAANLGVPLLPYDRMRSGAAAIDRRNGHDPNAFYLRRE